VMIISGTPGTGKTSLCEVLSREDNLEVISVNMLLEDYDLSLGVDDQRGYTIVDTERMIPIVDEIIRDYPDKTVVFEGHIAQDYPHADKVIVLRCNPEVLIKRLEKRNWSESKIMENVSAEVLGVCAGECYESYGDLVHEVTTDDKSPEELSTIVMDILCDKRECPIGHVDYMDDYIHLL